MEQTPESLRGHGFRGIVGVAEPAGRLPQYYSHVLGFREFPPQFPRCLYSWAGGVHLPGLCRKYQDTRLELFPQDSAHISC